MPQLVMPGGDTVQTIRAVSPPTAPYILRATIPYPSQQREPLLGVRKGATPTAWFPTELKRIASLDGVDLWHVMANIDSGADTLFEVDLLTDPQQLVQQQLLDPQGLPNVAYPSIVNRDARRVVFTEGAVNLRVEVDGVGSFSVSLTGGFDSETPVWSSGNGLNAVSNGYWIKTRFLETYVKHVPIVPGGSYGYLHVRAEISAHTPEVRFWVNWHNGGIEQRVPGSVPAPGDYGPSDEWRTPPDAFGQARINDIIFSRAQIRIDPGLVEADGFAGAWTWSPKFQDPAMRTQFSALVRQASDTDADAEHVIPWSFKRPFRFAVHPTGSVTPYGKQHIGIGDWSGDLSAMGLKRMGCPDPTAAPMSSINLSAEKTAAEAALLNLTPWSVEGESTSLGMNPVSFLYPGSWSAYGGQTAGNGMWPDYGWKALCGQQDAITLLEIEQLRTHCRTYGDLYYNINGLPILFRQHAIGATNGTWRMFNRRFEKNNGVIRDEPFNFGSRERRVNDAAYNPGPTGQAPVDGDFTPNIADYWVEQLAGNAITPLPFDFTLAHMRLDENEVPPPAGQDLPNEAPVLLQIHGANTFDSTKSITVRITGRRKDGTANQNTIVLAGQGTAPNAPFVQAAQTGGLFAEIDTIEVTAITGTLLSSELFSLGRGSTGVPDYAGPDGITALDDQHAVRYHEIDKTLFMLKADFGSLLYMLASASLMHAAEWDGPGRAHRLDALEYGAPGRGNRKSRETAWRIDMICSAIACAIPIFGQQNVLSYWRSWLDKMTQLFLNSQMPNFGYQSFGGTKEFKQTPYGDRNGGEGRTVFYGTASREWAYFTHALYMLATVKGRPSAALKQSILDMAKGFRDFLWFKPAGVPSVGPHVYLPIALHRDSNGNIRYSDVPPDPNGTWEFFATQDDLPEVNPFTGCLINPTTYPTVDDDRYVAQLDMDTLVADTPFTLANADAGAGQPLVPPEIKVTCTANSFNNGKRRSFRITGTDWFDQVISGTVPVLGNGQATQVTRCAKHYKTITEIEMMNPTDAAQAGFPDKGTLLSTEKFKVGVGEVGLRYNNGNSPIPTNAEAYQLGYNLAIFKVLGDELGDSSAADQLILWYTGEANLADAKATIATWGEYSGGPTGRMEQWLSLLWALRNE